MLLWLVRACGSKIILFISCKLVYHKFHDVRYHRDIKGSLYLFVVGSLYYEHLFNVELFKLYRKAACKTNTPCEMLPSCVWNREASLLSADHCCLLLYPNQETFETLQKEVGGGLGTMMEGSSSSGITASPMPKISR